MKLKTTSRFVSILITIALLFSLVSITAAAAPSAAPGVPVSFSILHTNDFHGQLEPSNTDPIKASNPGMARTAGVVSAVRAAKGAANVLLVDAGDEMQGSLLSNLGDGTATGKGIPTIATYNAMGYNVATFGNHEFDWGQVNLTNRTTEATYPYVTANIVKMDGANCAASGWTKPDFADAPYQILTVGTAPDTVKVAFIGVTTTETPTITVSTATAGLCFKDPAESIIHYYDAMKAAGADVIVVLSHLGYADGGYGYGLPVYGDQTLAKNLINADKPVNLIIGGHSHTSVAVPGTTITVSGKTGSTLVTQAQYNGRRVGEADITVATDGTVTIDWKVIYWTYPTAPAVTPPSEWKITQMVGGTATTTTFADNTVKDAAIDTLITSFATDPAYLAIVNQPIGYSAVDLGRSNTTDNMMGAFIDDAIYNYLNTDAVPANDVDLFFNNAGGIRTDWCWDGATGWLTSGCVPGTHTPTLLTYGNMFTVLPFGNATVVGDMTGEQIMEVVNYGPNVAGVIQPAGLKYKYYSYKDANPGPQPFAWGAYDICVKNKVTLACDPLDLKKTYRVGTNEFLAPAGGDGYSGFKYMTNITYWGDMLNAVNAYVAAQYGTVGTAYQGPNGDGTLDGRIIRNGTDAVGSGDIIPVTVLHHNDMHGNLAKGTYVGYTQLATLIKQERLHNPTRTLLLNSGDNIQGDGLSFFYKTSYTGKAVDGTVLDPSLTTNPIMAVMNSMNYDAMTLGNHEFNFGSDVFKGVLGQATFPVLQANVADTGAYGLSFANGGTGVQPYVEKTLDGIDIAILGIGNHRIPNYELPSNIPGLTFSNPLTKAQELSTALRSTNDVVLALTHIGFTEDPKSVEVDANVDTNMAATVTGLDAIVGGHSHTNPATGFGNYKYLPTFVVGPDNTTPVIIGHAYRYNNTLGEIVLGVRAKVGGGYEVVTRSGRYLSVVNSPTATAEDAATKAIVDPYLVPFNTYNNTVIGDTNTPIDALQAYTQETSGANLQADAAVEALRKTQTVDFHLSGAMTNKATAGPYPQTLKVSDMFTLMPYENSLVVLSMNGPELKAVLERGYRNYYYYKYVPGYGGYSYYTTCMLDINSGGTITYNDLNPALPNGNNVVSLVFDKAGVPTTVDFTDATTHYNVSTVNYLAAGSCNFNNSGVTLWPLDSIVADTQLYVRDAVIDYIKANTPVAPAVEGRLNFISDPTSPTVSSSVRVNPNPTGLASVDFTVTFSEPVTGVDMVGPQFDDFALTTSSGISGASVTGVSGSGATYTVTVNTGAGGGTIRLDVPATATITDLVGNSLSGLPFSTGEAYTVRSVDAYVAGVLKGSYFLNTGQSTRQNYAGVDSGPVKVISTSGTPIITALRDAWAVNGVTQSFSQLMGLPLEQLSDTYVFPGYNNVTLDDQLRIANLDTIPSTVTVTIGGNLKGTYTLAAGQAMRVNYPGLDSGPVVVQGTSGVKIISSIREAWAVNGVTTSFTQLMGLPAGQLSNKYVFAAYNNVTLNEQLRIANVGAAQSVVTVKIGGTLRGTYTLQPNQAVRVNYPGLDSGPVIVEGTAGVNIIAAIRDAWAVNGVTTSFSQLMGMPAGQLSDKYLFPAYNNVTLNDQLRIGNADSSPTTVTVTIGGVLKGTYPLAVGQAIRINYVGLDSGPVVVQGTSGVKIISSIREAWAVNGVTTSFTQFMGLPAGQLSTTYFFPAYNNVTLNEQLRIGMP